VLNEACVAFCGLEKQLEDRSKCMARRLVIDDEKNVRKMVHIALVRDGHEVGDAEDGPQGLERFGTGTDWDLVLVDQRMPGMDGRAVIREMRTRDPRARIVMVTAFDSVQLAAEVLTAGATDFLRKPLSTQSLRGAVSAALGRSQEVNTEASVADASAPSGEGTPSVSLWLNGFRYWPVPAQAARGESAVHDADIIRAYNVNGPFGNTHRCLVRLTPHVREQVHDAMGGNLTDDAPVWDVLCESALNDYLWVSADMPPDLLPLYDLTLAQLQIVTDMPR
jgi:DNA-binding response OmpR family regulator